MGLTRRVEKKTMSEAEIDNLIKRGASVKEDIKVEESKKSTHINFRIPTDLLAKVDDALKERVGISRNGWILEAIQEKLKRFS